MRAILLLALARLTDVASVGEYAAALALCTPIALAGRLSLREQVTAGATQTFTRNDHLRALATAASLSVLISVVVAAVVFPVKRLATVSLVALTLNAESFSFLAYGVLQHSGRFRRMAVSTSARALVTIVAATVSLLATHSLRPFLIAILSVTGLFALVDVGYSWSISNQAVETRREHRFARSLRLVALSIPLGAAALVTSLYQNIPRLVLDKIHGSSELAVFSLTAYLGIGTTAVVLAIGQVNLAQLGASEPLSRPAETRRYVRRFLGMTMGISSLGILVAFPYALLLETLLGRSYFEPLLALLLAVSALLGNASVPFTNALIAGTRNRQFFMSTLILAVTTVAASLLLVPGLASFGVAASLIVGNLGRLFYAHNRYRAAYGRDRPVRLLHR